MIFIFRVQWKLRTLRCPQFALKEKLESWELWAVTLLIVLVLWSCCGSVEDEQTNVIWDTFAIICDVFWAGKTTLFPGGVTVSVRLARAVRSQEELCLHCASANRNIKKLKLCLYIIPYPRLHTAATSSLWTGSKQTNSFFPILNIETIIEGFYPTSMFHLLLI